MPRRIAKKRTPPVASIASENYLKHILALAQRGDDGRPRSQVLMSDLAAALALTRGTVTTQVKRLAREGLVHYERYGGVELTARGERVAFGVIHRHRLVETFLVRTLGLDWAEVHEEAERLEHVLSERVLQALDRWLGLPAVDPHGDPIPRQSRDPRRTPNGLRVAHDHARGRANRMNRSRTVRSGQRLSVCTAGQRVRVERLLEQGAAFLRFASKHGVTPGTELKLLTRGRSKLAVRAGTARGRTFSMSLRDAAQVLVTVESTRLD